MSSRKHVYVENSKDLSPAHKTKHADIPDSLSTSSSDCATTGKKKKSKRRFVNEIGATSSSSPSPTRKDDLPSAPPHISRKRRIESSKSLPRKKSKIQQPEYSLFSPTKRTTPEKADILSSFSKLPQLFASCASSLTELSRHVSEQQTHIAPEEPPKTVTKTLRFSNVVQVILVEEVKEGVEGIRILTQDLKYDESDE
ncbi:hypothetical protein BDZ89DRAFT_1130753 [Hymenopellis radicata]|nr:hypothetical protein BDZ89DRAFT_1130753 [Hymenopellis radicata]